MDEALGTIHAIGGANGKGVSRTVTPIAFTMLRNLSAISIKS
jgi:hypothetical protein